MSERMMPNNIDAEKGVLGSLLIDSEAIVQVADFLKPEHFLRNAHRVLYETMLRLSERGEPSDFVTLCDALDRSGKMEDVGCESMGGPSYITSLVNCVPTSGNVERYGRIVANTALRRGIIHAGGQMTQIAFDEEDARVALEKSEQLVYNLSMEQSSTDFSSGVEIMDDLLSELINTEEQTDRVIGVPTGFDRLDFYLGNMQKTDLIVIAGRPSMGKSSLMLSIVYNGAILDGRRYGIFSLEMSKKQLYQRLISMDTGIETYRIRNQQIREWEWDHIMASREKLATDNLWIDDTAGISLQALRSKARRLHSKHPLDALFVDYAQLMKGSAENKGNRVAELGEITMGLKNLAKELDIPVVALAQLSRAVEQRAIKIPQLSDLRESGSIENDADVVMFIYRDEVYNPNSPRKGIADIIIAKHRNGPTGEVALTFENKQTQFKNLLTAVPTIDSTGETEGEGEHDW